MDTKNVIAAISLSAAVIILYSLFFAPSPQELNKINKDNIKNELSSETPMLEENNKLTEVSRMDALNLNKRFSFKNKQMTGSISLIGGVIDDLTFENYTQTLNGSDKIVLLNPKQVKNGYFVETGWVTNNKNIDIPNSKTEWSISGNNKLIAGDVKLYIDKNVNTFVLLLNLFKNGISKY